MADFSPVHAFGIVSTSVSGDVGIPCGPVLSVTTWGEGVADPVTGVGEIGSTPDPAARAQHVKKRTKQKGAWEERVMVG